MKHHNGRIEVICGSMFSGKTEELIRRIRRAEIAKQKVQVFKPSIDDRYSRTSVTSHNGHNTIAENIETPNDIFESLKPDTTVVAIDEIQFVEPAVVDVIMRLANQHVRVIVAGLDMDFRGEPFGVMPTLMALAEEVTKLNAICTVCGELASHTQRLVDGQPAHYNDPVIQVGAIESYEARCREHHYIPGAPEHAYARKEETSFTTKDG